MVYCGPPSKNCQACREKKTRCDRALPECGQCIRAKRPCFGYRDELDLMFRNESNAVAKKSKTRSTKSKLVTKKPPSLHNPHVANENHAYRIPAETLPSKLSTTIHPTIEEIAGAFFNTNYEMRSVGGSFDYFTFDNLDTLCTAEDMSANLVASVNAVGLAGFASSIHSTELMKKAFDDYGKAIRLTNAALQSPIEVTKDSTLFSIVILSIFETVTGSTQNSFRAWTEHTKGASTLVKLRGVDQFKTHAGRRLFLQITSNLMISCIQRTVAMPDYISELRLEAEKFVESANPAWIMSKVIIDCSDFRAGVMSGSITGSQSIITRAMEIDRQFVEIFSNIPESWQYTIIYTDEYPEYVWNGFYHSYQNYWIAQIWNAMRTCRILLHEIIHSQLKLILAASPLPFSEQESINLYQHSFNILIQLRSDILASVPEHTKSKITSQAAHRDGPYSETEHPQSASALQGTRGYFMLWPLYLVGSMDLGTEEIRSWVTDRLRLLARETGIRQAEVLADFVAINQPMSVWDREERWNGLQRAEMGSLLENAEGSTDLIGIGNGRGSSEPSKRLRVLSY